MNRAVHELGLYPQYFALVVDRSKRVEVRVASPAKLAIRVGDLLRFSSGRDRVLAEVVRVTRYPDFPALLEQEEVKAINRTTDRSGALAALRDIYGPREELGALAIEFSCCGPVGM